jgi:hypothetical protein
MPQESAIKRRVAPSVPLTLELLDDSGAKFTRNFRLSFDFNALARIEEVIEFSMLNTVVWSKLSAGALSAMLWGAVLAHHPEYETVDEKGERTEEGLRAIRSYVDFSNVEKITNAVWDAYLLSLPKETAERAREAKAAFDKAQPPNEPTPAEGPAPEQPQSSTGTNSGPSLVMTSVSAIASSAG